MSREQPGPFNFDDAQREARRLRDEIAGLKQQQKELDGVLMTEVLARGDTSVKIEGEGSWSIQNRTSRRIDKAKLVAAGVDIEVITGATTETTSDPFLVWRQVKEKD